MNSKIKKLITCLKDKIKYIDSQTIKNYRLVHNKNPLSFKDSLFHLSKYNYDSKKSHNTIISSLHDDFGFNYSKTAFLKKRTNVDFKYFSSFNDALVNLSYPKYKTPITFAIDGSTIILPKELGNHGCKIINDSYCHGYVHSLYDIDKEMPINLLFTVKKNERSALQNQFKYLNSGDLVIADRGYGSWKLFKGLSDIGVNYLIRIPTTFRSLMEELEEFGDIDEIDNINDLETEKDIIIDIVNNNFIGKMRLIKYELNNNIYYIATSMLDEPIAKIKMLYHRRWGVETNFRVLKHTLSMINIKSETIDSVKKDICIHNFILLLSSYMRNMVSGQVRKKYKIDMNVSIDKSINFIYQILYKSVTKKHLSKLLNIIHDLLNYLIKVEMWRTFDIKRIKPVAKWHYCKGES